MTLSSHTKRLATAALLLPILVAVSFAGGWWLFVALAATACLGLWEFYSLFWSGRVGLGKKVIGLMLGVAFLFAAKQEDPELIIGVLLTSFWIGNFLFLYWYSRRPDAANYVNAAIVVGGLIYLPLTLHFFLRFSPPEIFLVLAAAFISDTGAFYGGTRFGRRKLWPQISPKKTWEGSLSGLAACCLAVLAYGLALGAAPWWAWLLLAMALNVAAQLGDLFESALKRWVEVKDSGTLLPGHGGMLDRIDSLLLAVPVYAACRTLFPFFDS